MIPWLWFLTATFGYCYLLRSVKELWGFNAIMCTYIVFSMSMTAGILSNIR